MSLNWGWRVVADYGHVLFFIGYEAAIPIGDRSDAMLSQKGR
jgi:hypothetical protein